MRIFLKGWILVSLFLVGCSEEEAPPRPTGVCGDADAICDGSIGEGDTSSAATTWTEVIVAGQPRITALATHAKGHGWLAAAGGEVIRVEDSTLTTMTGCDSASWLSAWVSTQGRVFLGSGEGAFATLPFDADATEACERVESGHAYAITALIGFEQDDTVTLYGVDRGGYVLRWTYVEGASTQAAPVTLTQLAASLHDIDGTSPETLVIAGNKLVTGEHFTPVTWRAQDGAWVQETFQSPDPYSTFVDLEVVTPNLAYAVVVTNAGGRRFLMERVDGVWSHKTFPDGVLPGKLAAFGTTALYSATGTTLRFFDGQTWSQVGAASAPIWVMGGSAPDDVWAAGTGGVFLRGTP
ncbi:hypothetical protein LY474_20330 [Myxococcus stipitatus]|uniref:hypothetical protein n=1 Tax=Myxococcus stipitatus TaxID=83455 RepID=UPI001F214249|nr:hypothetical protein [Myxococcus stipitatus]MCE9670150.1 hypothetical protein [Myxococcus stipitatus]